MVALRTHEIIIFGGKEWQVASKNLLPEKKQRKYLNQTTAI